MFRTLVTNVRNSNITLYVRSGSGDTQNFMDITVLFKMHSNVCYIQSDEKVLRIFLFMYTDKKPSRTEEKKLFHQLVN